VNHAIFLGAADGRHRGRVGLGEQMKRPDRLASGEVANLVAASSATSSDITRAMLTV